MFFFVFKNSYEEPNRKKGYYKKMHNILYTFIFAIVRAKQGLYFKTHSSIAIADSELKFTWINSKNIELINREVSL